MKKYKIKSYAKLNLSLNIIGKSLNLHKIESIISFISLHDDISIKKIDSNNHKILFYGKFSKNIVKNNTVSKLLNILEEKKLLKDQKFLIKINKRIPNQAGLGGGSMNAANILKFLLKKKIIKITQKEVIQICESIGSDVILGINSTNSILTSKNKIKYFSNLKPIHVLIIKPKFGCSTKEIYSKVKRFYKSKLNKPSKKMFDLSFLKKLNNSLESIVFAKYPKLKSVKIYLENLSKSEIVRMTGSGSALVTYFRSKKPCDSAMRQFKKKYKNYWSIVSKTI